MDTLRGRLQSQVDQDLLTEHGSEVLRRVQFSRAEAELSHSRYKENCAHFVPKKI
jgi:hypothetical protein